MKREYENIKLYKYGNIQMHMQKNIEVKKCKRVCEEIKYMCKNYKVTSSTNVNIFMYIYIYIYIYI